MALVGDLYALGTDRGRGDCQSGKKDTGKNLMVDSNYLSTGWGLRADLIIPNGTVLGILIQRSFVLAKQI